MVYSTIRKKVTLIPKEKMRNAVVGIKNIWRLLLVSFLYCFSIQVYAKDDNSFKIDSIKAIELNNQGKAAGRQGDYEEALKKFKEVYEINLKLFGRDNVRLASTLNNIGVQYKNLQNFDKAIEQFKNAENLFIKTYGKDYPQIGAIYINLGNIYRSMGDFSTGLEYQRNAYRLLKNDSINLNELSQTAKYNIVEIQFKLGLKHEAVRFAQSNLKTTLPRLKPRLFDLIALSYKESGNFDLSEKNYLEAIKCWQKLYGESNIELADEYLGYSSLLMVQNKFDKALIYITKAKAIILNYSRVEKNPLFAEVQSSFGEYYLQKNMEAGHIDDFRTQKKKNLKAAIQYYQNAIVSLVDSFYNKDPFIDPPLEHVISEIQLVGVLKKKALAMDRLAEIYLSEFDYENSYTYYLASLNTLEKATQLIHRLQIGFENEESKLFLAQNQESTFSDAIKIAYRLFNQTKKREFIERAFEFSEQSKSSNLLASVKDMKAKEFGGIPDSLLKKENDLKSNIASYKSKLFEENRSEEPDLQKLNLFSAKIFGLNEEYNKLIDSFEKLYPSYFAFKYDNKVAGIGEIQSKLRARQALVEYFVNEPDQESKKGEIYRFLITKDSVSFHMENIDTTFISNIQVLHDFLINPDFLHTKKKDYVDYSMASYRLYEKLFKPLETKITGKDLTIIPHDKLSYIPFDALISQFPDTSKMNFRNLNYLVRDYAINYSYSATLLFNYFNQNRNISDRLLIFSPKYISDVPRIDPETSTPHYLSPLPGAKDEVLGIAKTLKSYIFIDEMAQESDFKQKSPEFGILHLAMHTIINDSLPMFSKLVFSEPKSPSNEDGYLNTYEIYNMKFNANLAVLSACETGTGKLQKGEGVMSMARGFIFAGCPSIVMTLWQVEDKSGAQIMQDFYYFLSKGKRKDVALRMAKIKHLDTSDPLTAHPHYWLGYVTIGSSEPLFTNKHIYFIILLAVVIIFVVTDLYFRRKRMRK